MPYLTSLESSVINLPNITGTEETPFGPIPKIDGYFVLPPTVSYSVSDDVLKRLRAHGPSSGWFESGMLYVSKSMPTAIELIGHVTSLAGEDASYFIGDKLTAVDGGPLLSTADKARADATERRKKLITSTWSRPGARR